VTYTLGIDLGTTYSAAAVHSGGLAEIFSLSNRSTVVPSVVFVAESGDILVGDAALRRGATEPERLCREFKRRIGDSAPLVVGGSPFSAEALTARLLRWVVTSVAEQRGEPPERITLSYPANWGTFKQERLAQAVRIADVSDLVPNDRIDTVTEPEAAAISYASTERVPAGEVIAVYDLGGGTFDAAVLRKTAAGFEVLGSPEGIERLGGIDIDEAVYSYVSRALGDAVEQLDPDDLGSARAVARLRQDCVEAKEALSSDTQVAIPVLLPNLNTEVRISRSELEAMVRPVLGDSVRALQRAIASADLAVADVDRVLLVGGSSRMPLVGEMVTEALGRPFFVDAHPKHAVALGAAISAATGGAPIEVAPPAPSPPPVAVAPPPPGPPSGEYPPPAPPSTVSASGGFTPPPPVSSGEFPPPAPVSSSGEFPAPAPVSSSGEFPPPSSGPSSGGYPSPSSSPSSGEFPTPAPVSSTGEFPPPPPGPPPGPSSGDYPPPASGPSSGDFAAAPRPTDDNRRKQLRLAAGGALVAALAVVAFVALRGGDGGGGGNGNGNGNGEGSDGSGLSVGNTVDVAEMPDGVAVGEDVWVASTRGAAVTRLDEPTGDVVESYPLDGEPLAVVIAEGSVWVTQRAADTVARLDPADGTVTATIEVPDQPAALTAGPGAIWVSGTGGTLTKIDPATNTPTVVLEDRGDVRNAAVTDTAVWVTLFDENLVLALDPATGEEIRSIPVGANPDPIVVAPSGVWVANRGDDTVTQIDPADGTITATVDVGDEPTGLAADGDDRIWVISRLGGRLELIDPASAAIVDDLPIGGRPLGIAVSPDTVWVTLSGDNQVVRVEATRN
jgi:YVTN family beta-propeller protein